jgi:hypothetical protein
MRATVAVVAAAPAATTESPQHERADSLATMDRRSALRKLAASGAVVAGASLVSQRAFADGGSPAGTQDVVIFGTPTLVGGNQFGPSGGQFGPNTQGALFAQLSNGVTCANGATLRRQFRVQQISSTGPPLTLSTSPSIPFGAWAADTGGGLITVAYTSPSGVSVIGGSLGLRVQHRLICCRPNGTISWRCFQVEILATFVGPSNTSISTVSQSSSLHCENPRPTCP